MAGPFRTSVTIRRADGSADPYETGSVTTVATDVDAHVSAPTGSDRRVGGQLELVDAILFTDAVPTLQRGDLITDELSGESWKVTWARTRIGFGLDHQKAGLVAVKGGADG